MIINTRRSMYNSSCSMLNSARLWDWYCLSNIRLPPKPDGPMRSTLPTVIWHWRTGFRIVLVKYTGNDHGIISGLHSCTPIISGSTHHPLCNTKTDLPSTTLCLLHRAHMPPATAKPHDYDNVDMAYPSRTIAFQAAGMITSIMENLLAHDQVKYQPAFMYVFSLHPDRKGD